MPAGPAGPSAPGGPAGFTGPGGSSARPGAGAGAYRRSGGVPDGLLVGGIALLLGGVTLFWVATALAGLITRGSLPHPLRFSDTPGAIRSLAVAPNDLPGAWPATPAGQLPGATAFWVTFFVLLGLLGAAVLAAAIAFTGARSRARAAREQRLREATRAYASATAGATAAPAGRPGSGVAPGSRTTGGGGDIPAAAPTAPVSPAAPTGLSADEPAAPAPPPGPADPAAPVGPAAPVAPAVPVGSTGGRAAATAGAPAPFPDLTGRTVCVFAPAPGTARQALLDAVRSAHPGPVLALTSALTDRHLPSGSRVFDPERILDPATDNPGAASLRVRWSPVEGCEDAGIAAARARALLAPARPLRAPALSLRARERDGLPARLSDGAAYEAALVLLRCWLHAAALAGRPVRQVLRWASGHQGHEAVRILRTTGDPRAGAGWSGELESVLSSPRPELRDAALELVRGALAALSELHVLQACTPSSPHDRLEVESFLREAGSLHLAGTPSEQRAPSGSAMPLLTALLEDVVEHGRRMAARSPSGRLDPPLLLLLDDVAAVAPIPSLPELLTHGGSLGMPTVAVLRSPEQARARWGTEVVHTLWTKSDHCLVLGGSDPEATAPVLDELAPESPRPGPDQAVLLRDRGRPGVLVALPGPRRTG